MKVRSRKHSVTRSLDANVDKIIGNKLRFLRHRQDWTQNDLADALGISFQQIQKYEKGANRVSASTLYKISQLLDVSIIDFFSDLDVSADAHKISEEEIVILRLYASLSSVEMRANVKRIMQLMAEF